MAVPQRFSNGRESACKRAPVHRDYRNGSCGPCATGGASISEPFAVTTGRPGIARVAHHALAIAAGAERVGKSAMLDAPPSS